MVAKCGELSGNILTADNLALEAKLTIRLPSKFQRMSKEAQKRSSFAFEKRFPVLGFSEKSHKLYKKMEGLIIPLIYIYIYIFVL